MGNQTLFIHSVESFKIVKCIEQSKGVFATDIIIFFGDNSRLEITMFSKNKIEGTQ